MKFFFRLKTQLHNPHGFTLIEVLIALAITGVVTSAVAATTYQAQSIMNRTSAHIIAVTQVENGIHYINLDVQSAQIVASQGTYGFPLSLTWVDWNTNVTNTVIYTLQSDSSPLTTFSLMRKLNQNPASPIARNIVYYPSCLTTVALTASPGNSELKVANTSAFPPVGALVIPGEPLPVTYFSKTASSFTGIPASGSGSLTLSHNAGESVKMFSTYTSYDSADHKLILQLTADVSRGGKQQEEMRQLVIIPRPGS